MVLRQSPLATRLRQRLAAHSQRAPLGHSEKAYWKAEQRVLRFLVRRQAQAVAPYSPSPAAPLDAEAARRSSYLILQKDTASRLGYAPVLLNNPWPLPTRQLTGLVRDATPLHPRGIHPQESTTVTVPEKITPPTPWRSEALEKRRLDTIELALLLAYVAFQTLVLSSLLIFVLMLA